MRRLLARVRIAVAAALVAAIIATIPATGWCARLAVHVRGNQLIDQTGETIRLLGVNRSGAEYECLGGKEIFDGPTDAASIAAMKSWNINAVRMPLNEDCWLGINGAAKKVSGPRYRRAIAAFVRRLNTNGLYVILDLHWNAPGKCLAAGQQVMADADHAVAFWASVAAHFKDNPAVLFDLYNEPHDITWECWKNGCAQSASVLVKCPADTVPSGQWNVAGMQELVNAVRSAGATQPIMMGGLLWAEDPSQWLSNEPTDPLAGSHRNPVRGNPQLAASVHSYCGPPEFTTVAQCEAIIGYLQTEQWPVISQVAANVPVVTGEFGEYDCATTYVNPYMTFADGAGISYLGWEWDPYDCNGGPALISDYTGTPTDYGIGLKNHLQSLVP